MKDVTKNDKGDLGEKLFNLVLILYDNTLCKKSL